MKLRYVATLVASGAAAAAIAAAPAAVAAPLTDIAASPTITQRDGHVAIDASPPTVSDARSYGPFSSPAPFIFFD